MNITNKIRLGLAGTLMAGVAFAVWLGSAITTGDLSPTNIQTYMKNIKHFDEVHSTYNSIFTNAKTYDDSLKITEEYHIPIGRKSTFEEKERIIKNYLAKSLEEKTRK